MASITHMGVPPPDHVLLYALRNITGGCPWPDGGDGDIGSRRVKF
jgi:hypothetical protein